MKEILKVITIKDAEFQELEAKLQNAKAGWVFFSIFFCRIFHQVQLSLGHPKKMFVFCPAGGHV